MSHQDPSGQFVPPHSVDPTLSSLVTFWTWVYSKDGWANCANRPDDGQSTNDGVLDLFIEDFICEYGNAVRFFRSDAPLTRELALSGKVDELRAQFYKQGDVHGRNAHMSPGEGIYAKTIDSLLAKQTISITDFLGGFDQWDIEHGRQGTKDIVRFRIRNVTSLESGTRNPLASPGIPLSIAEYIQNPYRYNRHDTAFSGCAYEMFLDKRYTLNAVLPSKPAHLRDSRMKTGLGGSNITQIFIWEEIFDPYYKLQPHPSVLPPVPTA